MKFGKLNKLKYNHNFKQNAQVMVAQCSNVDFKKQKIFGKMFKIPYWHYYNADKCTKPE